MCLEKIKSRPSILDPPFDFEMEQTVPRYTGNLVEILYPSRDRERDRGTKMEDGKGKKEKKKKKKTSNATTRDGQKKEKKVAHNEALYSS